MSGVAFNGEGKDGQRDALVGNHGARGFLRSEADLGGASDCVRRDRAERGPSAGRTGVHVAVDMGTDDGAVGGDQCGPSGVHLTPPRNSFFRDVGGVSWCVLPVSQHYPAPRAKPYVGLLSFDSFPAVRVSPQFSSLQR